MMDAESKYAAGLRATLTGFFVSVGLATVKLVAGLLGHSYALVADAVESMADIFGSLVVWGGLRISAKPPDQDHPYGHGKAEQLAALFVALMIAGAGIGIIIQAVREIRTPHHAPAPFTLWVLISVVIVKELLFRRILRAADVSGSGAVHADAWHHRSDAITSAAAAIGISIALIGGEAYAAADDWAALFASGIILYNAWRLLRRPLHELMEAEPTETIARVRTVAAAIPGVADVEKVFARKSGIRYWVDMHIEVNPELSVRAAHALAHDVKDAILAAMPDVQDVLIHVEPHEPAR